MAIVSAAAGSAAESVRVCFSAIVAAFAAAEPIRADTAARAATVICRITASNAAGSRLISASIAAVIRRITAGEQSQGASSRP